MTLNKKLNQIKYNSMKTEHQGDILFILHTFMP